jgi:hypothetical protein
LIRPLTMLLACATAAALLYFLFLRRGPSSPPNQSASTNAASAGIRHLAEIPAQPPASSPAGDPGAAPAALSVTPSTFPITAVAPATPFLLGSADKPPAMEPATVLGNMRIAIHQYGSQFGGNPVGTNPEITQALNGNNPKQAKFLSVESGLRINARGELVDYWGTPFFFHQLSGTEMEIRSAGPDRVMWTADDLMTK